MECEVLDMPMAEGENGLPASVSLNNASWTVVNEETTYKPYGIEHIYPNSGPDGGGTDITVVGSGFVNNGLAKCRFGVPGEYVTVDATYLSDNKITCRSP